MNTRGTLWYRFVRAVARYVGFALLGGFRVVHAERVPRTGPLIVAPIHVSHLDPPAVACGLTRATTFMAKEELFRPFLLRHLIRSLGSFPVRRGENDTEAIRKAIELLKLGHAVLIFPEGTRGDGITMAPIAAGIAMIAKRTEAQVLPVGIIGTHIALPKGRSKPKRSRITISFGEPFTFAEIAATCGDQDPKAAFAATLGDRIAAACAAEGMPVKSAGVATREAKSRADETANESTDHAKA